jgi:hypothetical protein
MCAGKIKILNRRISMTSERVLKVMIAKMSMEGEESSEDEVSPCRSPARRRRKSALRFDAPSPNGTTDAGVIVSYASLHYSDFHELHYYQQLMSPGHKPSL